MKRRTWSLVELLLKYWQPTVGLGAAMIALIVFLATLAPRLSAQEQKNAAQDRDISDLEGWAKELQGYTRAMQQQQQMPNAMRPMPLPQPSIHRLWDDTERRYYCQTEEQWWWADGEGYCE